MEHVSTARQIIFLLPLFEPISLAAIGLLAVHMWLTLKSRSDTRDTPECRAGRRNRWHGSFDPLASHTSCFLDAFVWMIGKDGLVAFADSAVLYTA